MTAAPPVSEAALLRVFREQRPRLWGFFVRSCGSQETAEDLLQETFLRAWDHRAELAMAAEQGDRDALRRYLWRVARNLMIDEIRGNVRQRERGPHQTLHAAEREMPVRDAHNPDPAERVEHADCLLVLRDTVSRLTNRRTRRCLQLWLGGKTVTEIASATRLDVGQVRGLLQRGKAEVILRATNRLRLPAESGGPA